MSGCIAVVYAPHARLSVVSALRCLPRLLSLPFRWIKSEVDLDEEVKRWTQIAASPSLFPHLFESGAFALLVSLLTHANSDLAIDVVEVFSELTEADSVMEAPDPQATVQQLVSNRHV